MQTSKSAFIAGAFILCLPAVSLAQDEDDGEFRRARLGMRIRYDRDWVFTSSVDLVDKPRLRDLSLEYRGLPVRIEVGRFQEPFGLAEYGSSKDTLFMERPSPSSFGPDYGLGAALNYRAPMWAISVGAFAANDSPQFGGDRNESALTGRLNFTPLRGTPHLHVGASYSQRKSDETGGPRLRGSAETILVTGYTPRSLRDPLEDEYRVSAGEAALRVGSVLVQAEYFDVASDGVIEGDGWYAEAGWILTGEKRRYSTRFGSFDGVNPKRPIGRGGFGALEVGVRYSEADFSETGGDRGTVAGVALNWYPIENIRFSVNAQRVTFEELTLAEIETDVIQGRVQVYF